MLSKKELFEKIADYDFRVIKDYLENGGDIEVYDRYGNSILSAFIESYYYHVYYSDPDDMQFLEEHYDDEEYHKHVNKYSKILLGDRPHLIKEQIDYLIRKGVTPNAVGWKEAKEEQEWAPRVETPLFHSVVNCDYCMTEYLLKNGADPRQKLFSDGDYDEVGYEDWLIEHLDIYIFNGDCGDAGTNDLEIAALLMHYGLDQWSGGMCIDVDKEKLTIHGHSSRFLY